MTDKRKIGLAIGVCIVVVLAAVAAYVLIRRKDEDIATEQPATTDTSSNNTMSVSDGELKLGSRGQSVRQLQMYLNGQLLANYYVRSDYPVDKSGKRITQLKVDGIFGEQTQAVCLWQFGKTTAKLEDIC